MSFTGTVTSWCELESARIERTRRILIIDLFGSIVKDTPVLWGRLRGDWRTSVGNPNLTPPDLDGKARDVSAVTDEILEMALIVKGDQAVYFTNMMPYAQRIEFEGWSDQAPEGMVRKNVARYLSIATDAIAKAQA